MAFTAREGATYACLGWAVAQMSHPAMAGKWADAPLVPAPLAAAIEPQVFRCIFPQSAGAAPFEIHFVITDDGRGLIVGNLGASDVEIHAGSEAISFIERLVTGVVQTTTIAKDGQAVHSRHTLFHDGFGASQMMGRCR